MVYAFFATRIRPQKHYLPLKPRSNLSTRPIAVGNTGFCRPISLRSIRALATLLPLSGQYAPPLRLCARATPLRAYAYATALLPLAIRAFVALFRCAQYGLLLRFFPSRGNTLRRSGYVLGLCPCAHTPTQPARLPLAIRAKVT